MGVCIAINNDLAHDYSVDYFICEMGRLVSGELERKLGDIRYVVARRR